MSPRANELGPLEMEVLGLIESPTSVTDLQKKLKAAGRDLAYTTVMTVLVRLHKKGCLVREKCGRQFLYSQAKTAATISRKVLGDVTRNLFRQERLAPIMAMIQDGDNLSMDELKELRSIVNTKLDGLGNSDDDLR